MKKNTVKKILCFITVLSIVFLSGCSSPEEIKKQKRITEYMENKYGIPFKIVSMNYGGRQGVYSYNVASKSPDYPNAWGSVDIFDEATPTERITDSDSFSYQLLQSKCNSHLQKLTPRFFGDKAYFLVGRCMLSDEAYKEMAKPKVDLQKIASIPLDDKNTAKNKGYEIVLTFVQDFPNDNYDPLYKEIFEWIKYQKNMGMTYSEIQLMGYHESALKAPKILELLEKLKKVNMGTSELDSKLNDYSAYGTVGDYLRVRLDLEKINTIDDLKAVLKIQKIR